MPYSKRSSSKRSSTKRRSKSRRRNNKKIIKDATSIKHLIIVPMKEGGGKRSKKTHKLRRH